MRNTRLILARIRRWFDGRREEWRSFDRPTRTLLTILVTCTLLQLVMLILRLVLIK